MLGEEGDDPQLSCASEVVSCSHLVPRLSYPQITSQVTKLLFLSVSDALLNPKGHILLSPPCVR